jgi:hypothetical protein
MSFQHAKWLGALAIGLLPMAVSGCGGTCSSYCETYITCIGEDLQEVGCDFDDKEEDVIEDCEQECDEAYDRLTGDESGEADACIDCIFEEVGDIDSCDAGDFNDAASDCDNECEEDGAEEFAERFFEDFNVDIRCNNAQPGPG